MPLNDGINYKNCDIILLMIYGSGRKRGDTIKDVRWQFLKSCLMTKKSNVVIDRYTFVNRKKNINFIRQHLLTIEDVKISF
ncbi:hypothetical protein PRVXT_000242 [Proteinivorax tanatarense]|uniref:Uncharacterized protein n=1 Tax=Proteinivorax tanatarense TaxID=1260629 RepID=A0AAU7VMM6_9FIRM